MALLCDPYLLDPWPGGVHVLWHTDAPGDAHAVLAGAAVADLDERAAVAALTGGRGPGWRCVPADTTPMSRTRSDGPDAPVRRPVYRHLARVDGLPAGRTPYRVVSTHGPAVSVSETFTLAPAVPAGAPVRLLLTSDHQLKPMVPANVELAAATLGVELDGVLFAGDLVNVPDRAGDWFGSPDGPAFFPTMTGRVRHPLSGRLWRGAPLLQHSPLFPAIGNHEVMGRWSQTAPLAAQFDDPRPDDWDVTTYGELFPVPASAEGGPRWWARSIGDVRVVALFVTRSWQSDVGATFQELPQDVADPARWRHGQFGYEPIGPGSAQDAWLRRELASPAFRSARFRVVMFHHPPHGLGRHSAPPFTEPVPSLRRDPVTGAVTAVRYAYPAADDVLLGQLEPVLSSAGVHLVFTGHSHVWNRFRNSAGVHWLESSNVGNSYGAYHRTSGLTRPLPPDADHPAQGDPGGLEPVLPTVAPLTGADGTPLPYLSSPTVTAFTVLDSGAGMVRSYRFDTARPDGEVVLFDEFALD